MLHVGVIPRLVCFLEVGGFVADEHDAFAIRVRRALGGEAFHGNQGVHRDVALGALGRFDGDVDAIFGDELGISLGDVELRGAGDDDVEQLGVSIDGAGGVDFAGVVAGVGCLFAGIGGVRLQDRGSLGGGRGKEAAAVGRGLRWRQGLG